jgi:hypothetical protein
MDHKVAVVGMLSRHTREVRAKVVPNVRRETLQAETLKNVGRSDSRRIRDTAFVLEDSTI